MTLRLFLLLLIGLWSGSTANAQTPNRKLNRSWPDAPKVELEWAPRPGKKTIRWTTAEPEWTVEQGRRHARITKRVNDTAFLVWFEQFKGIDATRVTVAAINGFAFAGPRYFKRYSIHVEGNRPEVIEGRHVILPRGALIRRFFTGRQNAMLREWRYVHANKPVPKWAVAGAQRDTAKRTEFPFRDQNGVAIDIGPYNFFWNNRGLEDSHGGWGVGPFHGGPDDWLACAAGRQNREAEMLLAFQRPIWMLADDFEALEVQAAYWMGRTRAHDPAEYQYEVDDWCPYAKRLSVFRFADHTHLSRGTSGAAAIAKWDVFAVECLGAVLNDFKVAQSLNRVIGKDENGRPIHHPGAKQGNHLLFPLWKKIEVFDGPQNGAGDRGLAHKLRLLRWCRPYFPKEKLEPWEDGMRALVRVLADDYGITGGGNAPGWASEAGSVLTEPLKIPYAYTFHQQLVAYECQRFGGLDDIGEKAARFLTRRPPSIFEVRKGKPRDNVFDRHNSADKHQRDKKWAYEAYGNFTHDVLNGFSSARAFLERQTDAGVNGASQDLDNTPRHLWEDGL